MTDVDTCPRSDRGGTVALVSEQPQGRSSEAGWLPPLPAPDAAPLQRHEAVLARMVARFGAPSLDDYRHVFAAAGLSWPGDEEVRRTYPLSEPGRAVEAERTAR